MKKSAKPLVGLGNEEQRGEWVGCAAPRQGARIWKGHGKAEECIPATILNSRTFTAFTLQDGGQLASSAERHWSIETGNRATAGAGHTDPRDSAFMRKPRRRD